MEQTRRPRIVVGIAEPQPATLTFAVNEARRMAADLDIVHCAGYTNYAARVLDQIYFEDWKEAAGRVLDDARRFIDRGFDPPRSTYRLTDQSPSNEFLSTSASANALVLGADRTSQFERMLSPAVAHSAARSARCPVFIVPESDASTVSRQGVVVALEAMRPEEHLLRFAFEHADAMEQELHVLHTLPADAWIGEVEIHQALVSESLAGWRDQFPGVAVHTRFVTGEPTRMCAQATRRAQLLIVGRPRSARLPMAGDRPLTAGLLSRARGPIAVIPRTPSRTPEPGSTDR